MVLSICRILLLILLIQLSWVDCVPLLLSCLYLMWWVCEKVLEFSCMMFVVFMSRNFEWSDFEVLFLFFSFWLWLILMKLSVLHLLSAKWKKIIVFGDFFSVFLFLSVIDIHISSSQASISFISLPILMSASSVIWMSRKWSAGIGHWRCACVAVCLLYRQWDCIVRVWTGKLNWLETVIGICWYWYQGLCGHARNASVLRVL